MLLSQRNALHRYPLSGTHVSIDREETQEGQETKGIGIRAGYRESSSLWQFSRSRERVEEIVDRHIHIQRATWTIFFPCFSATEGTHHEMLLSRDGQNESLSLVWHARS